MDSFIEEKNDLSPDSTPTLSDVLKVVIDNVNFNLKCCLPAEVLNYDGNKQTVDVKPSLKIKYRNDVISDYPIIYNVPVCFPRTASSYIVFPIKPEDHVMLVFSDRSLEKWMINGESTLPDDPRTHHLTDAIAIPGLYPQSKNISLANSDDVILMNQGDGGKLEIRLKTNNHIQVLNGKNEELVRVLSDMLNVIRDAVIYTSTGTQKLRHFRFSEIQNRLDSFKET